MCFGVTNMECVSQQLQTLQQCKNVKFKFTAFVPSSEFFTEIQENKNNNICKYVGLCGRKISLYFAQNVILTLTQWKFKNTHSLCLFTYIFYSVSSSERFSSPLMLRLRIFA
jgi:hypothetical protein